VERVRLVTRDEFELTAPDRWNQSTD
jgi:hypothetical protein